MEQRKERIPMKDECDLAGVANSDEGGNTQKAVNSLTGWFERNGNILFLSFLIGLIVYFNFYSRELVNPDSAWYWGQYQSGEGDLSTGRWGLKYILALRSYLVSPMLSTALLLLFYSLAALLFAELFEVKNKSLRLLFCLTIVCSQLVEGTITNYFISDAYALGFLLAVAAPLYVNRHSASFLHMGLGMTMLAISISLYQSNVGVAAAICGMYIFMLSCVKQEHLKCVLIQVKDFIILGAGGCGLYYVIWKALLNYYGVQVSSYKGASNIGVSYIIRNLGRSIQNCYLDFYEYFFENTWKNNNCGLLIYNKALFAVFAAILLYYLFKYKHNLMALLLAFFLLLLIPVLANAIDLFAPDTRVKDTLLTAGGLITIQPFLISMAYIMSPKLKMIRVDTIIRMVAPVLAVCIIWSSILINTADGIVLQVGNNRNIQVVLRVYQTLERAGYYPGCPLVIAGVPDAGNYPAERFLDGKASSCTGQILWYGSGMMQWASILHRYCGVNIYQYHDFYQVLNNEQLIRKSPEFAAMPIYPNEGSVKVINGIYVAKLSE